jgi:DNA-binding NarL/FixJ family response regulator
MEAVAIKLSKRERQCLYLASCDLSTRETAEKMHLSYDTVKSHRRFVMRKLNCKSMAGAVTRAIEMKLVELKI